MKLKTLRISKYKPLNDSKDMIGKASFYFSAINSIDGSDVRISKRSKVPYSRLRGFENGKIGQLIMVIMLVEIMLLQLTFPQHYQEF